MPLNLSRRLLLLSCLASCVTLLSSGCLTSSKRVVFIEPTDTLVRIGPGVKGKVYYYTGEGWELSHNKVEIPEGWVAGPMNLPEGDAE
jgi:hypothetical protein